MLDGAARHRGKFQCYGHRLICRNRLVLVSLHTGVRGRMEADGRAMKEEACVSTPATGLLAVASSAHHHGNQHEHVVLIQPGRKSASAKGPSGAVRDFKMAAPSCQLLTYLALRRLQDHQKTTGNCLHMPRSNPAPQQHSVQSHDQDFEGVAKNSQVSLLRWSAWCASSGAGSGSWDRLGTIWRVGEPP